MKTHNVHNARGILTSDISTLDFKVVNSSRTCSRANSSASKPYLSQVVVKVALGQAFGGKDRGVGIGLSRLASIKFEVFLAIFLCLDYPRHTSPLFGDPHP